MNDHNIPCVECGSDDHLGEWYRDETNGLILCTYCTHLIREGDYVHEEWDYYLARCNRCNFKEMVYDRDLLWSHKGNVCICQHCFRGDPDLNLGYSDLD